MRHPLYNGLSAGVERANNIAMAYYNVSRVEEMDPAKLLSETQG